MILLNLICLTIAIINGANGRLHRRFSERHGLSKLGTDRLVPNPADTSPRLDQVEASVNDWSPSRLGGVLTIAGVTSGEPINATYTATNISSNPEASIGVVGNLDQALKDIVSQSNSGIAQVSGSLAMNSMAVDLLRLNVSKFEDEVKKNISRIDSILNELGDATSNGLISDLQTLRSRIEQIQSQLNGVSASGSGSGIIKGFTDRISSLGTAVTSLGDRLASLERRTTVDTSSSSSSSSQPLSSDTQLDKSVGAVASLQFVLQSWSGRIALGGAACGLVALILASIAMARIPGKPSEAPAPEAAEEEQVLMEAGEGDNAEQQGEEVYYEGEEQVVEQTQ